MNAKNPILVAIVGAAVVAFGFYHFVLGPKREEAAAVKAKVADAQGELDQARTLLESNSRARAGFKRAYATVVRLGKAVPGDDDVRSLVVELDHAAQRTHVDFQSIEVSGAAATATAPSASTAVLPPGATVGPAGFPVIPFTFSFRGEFFRLGKFFQRLDAFVKKSNSKLAVSGRLLTIDALKLEPDTTGFPNIKATVEATSYLVSPLEGATAGAGPAGPAGAAPAAPAGGAAPPTTTAASTGGIR